MGKSVLKIHRADAATIKKLLIDNEAYTVGLRLYMVYLVALGHSSRKLAELHNISFKQITNWVHRFENEGVDGLKDKKGRGRHSNLTNEQMLKVKFVIVNDLPLKYGFQSEKWTGPMVLQWIKNEYGVEYQLAQIYNLMDKVGIAFEKKHGLVKASVNV